jgi:hypothetical protein
VGALIVSVHLLDPADQGATVSEPGIALNERRAERSWSKVSVPRYGLSLAYPPDWQAHISGNDFLPVITVAPEGELAAPLRDPSANHTHLTIYPRGMPEQLTIPGARREIAGENEALMSVTRFDLVDGSPWALRARFAHTEDLPELGELARAWGPQAALVAALSVEGSVVWCERHGERVPDEDCDPLFGDVWVRDGGVSSASWQTLERILASVTVDTTHPDNRVEEPVLARPEPFSRVRSPLVVAGTSPRGYAFEGFIRVTVHDSENRLLGEAFVRYDLDSGEFSGTLTFDDPITEDGTLTLHPPGIPTDQELPLITTPLSFAR